MQGFHTADFGGPRYSRATKSISLALLVSLGIATQTSCSRGSNRKDGGGRVSLENIVFPDPTNQSTGRDVQVPDQASIVQRIVFSFSGTVPLSELNSDSIQIRDSNRAAVPGIFVREGAQVTFYPTLPKKPVTKSSDTQFENGGAGLVPNAFFDVMIPIATQESISTLVSISEKLWKRYDFQRSAGQGYVGRNYPRGARSGLFSIRFRTSSREEDFLGGYDQVIPQLIASNPDDGAIDVSPFLYTDPDRVFDSLHPIRLEFDHPLDPSLSNVGESRFRLVNIQDHSGTALDLELGLNVEIAVNEFNRSVVEIRPSGILPLGNTMGVFYPGDLRGLSGASAGSLDEVVAIVFAVDQGPAGLLRDVFREEFDSRDYEETNFEQLGIGVVPANWNAESSNDLRSSFKFDEAGVLGPFVPVAPSSGTAEIILDTNAQALPLFDGSTPEARPGTTVYGGVFNFTRIAIPEGVVLRGQGRNPLVLNATEDVVIDGEIDVSGINGTSVVTFDSAVAPTPAGPGGPGGGHGGVGNPTIHDGGEELMRIVPPRFAQHGMGPGFAPSLGGRGGEGGTTADLGLHCVPTQHPDENNGSRGAGGGGGSFLSKGRGGRNGYPNDGQDIVVSLQRVNPQNIKEPLFLRQAGPPAGGAPGDSPFLDSNDENNYIGATGEIQAVQGGQGGGGGGNRHDSNYCWMKNPGFPGAITDSSGGGGGGGGGALVIRAFGNVRLQGHATLSARGGRGGCGEQITCGNWGGSAGGGSGGAIILQSAGQVVLEPLSTIDVRGGQGCYAVEELAPINACGAQTNPNIPGSGGDGGDGLVQLQVPFPGDGPQVAGTIIPESSYIDPEKTPSEFTPISVGQSRWIDVGQVIRRSEESPTWRFRGTHPSSGYVMTEQDGSIVDAESNSFRVDLPPVFDATSGSIVSPGVQNFIPKGASVRIQFQAANAVSPGSKEVDPHSIIPGQGLWASDITIGKGRQFLRFRVTFNIADESEGYVLSAETRTPVMKFIRLPFEF